MKIFTQFRLWVLLLCTVGITQNLFSQEIANNVVYEENVDSSSNAIQLDNSSATLNSDSGFILNTGAEVGILELQYPGTLNSIKTTYTKIDFDQTILDALLQSSLVDHVGDMEESVLILYYSYNLPDVIYSRIVV